MGRVQWGPGTQGPARERQAGGVGGVKWIGLHRRAAQASAAAHGSCVGKSLCAGSLTESMTESETNLKPALRRDEIMPVGSFWFLGLSCAADISRLPPSLLPFLRLSRPGPMANITATVPPCRREGKIMICRCKHTCESQGRSPVLDCPCPALQALHPRTEHFLRTGDFLRCETGGPRFRTFDDSSSTRIQPS